jgi:YHS domain-containing protein
MVGLGWILRIIAVLLVIRLLMRFFAGLREGLSGGTRTPSGKVPGPRVGGRLVRDPQCGTHVPESNALRLGTGETAVYFCSETCRDRWAATH